MPESRNDLERHLLRVRAQPLRRLDNPARLHDAVGAAAHDEQRRQRLLLLRVAGLATRRGALDARERMRCLRERGPEHENTAHGRRAACALLGGQMERPPSLLYVALQYMIHGMITKQYSTVQHSTV